jgi:predicted RNA-binding protein with PUA-like domain
MRYWLMKSEPSEFSIDDLERKGREPWDGVRNYQARTMLRDEMSVGDLAFFYHSNCPQPGISGIMQVIKAGYPDSTAFDPTDPHYDPKSQVALPRWYRVDVGFVTKFSHCLSLSQLKTYPELAQLPLVKRGNRLSVMPVTTEQWHFILALV